MITESQEIKLANFLTEENATGDKTFHPENGVYVSEGKVDADDADFLEFLNEGA